MNTKPWKVRVFLLKPNADRTKAEDRPAESESESFALSSSLSFDAARREALDRLRERPGALRSLSATAPADARTFVAYFETEAT